MKKTLKRVVSSLKQPKVLGATIFIVAFAALGVFLLTRSLAVGERIYINPSEVEVEPGDTLTVTLRLNGGSGVQAVETILSYDKDKLQFVSIDETSSGFPQGFISSGGDGTVNVTRGQLTGSVTSDIEIAKVTFSVIASTSSTTALTLSGQTSNTNGDVLVPAFGNSTVTISAEQPVARSASFRIEPTVAAPVVGAQFGLKVYVSSTVPMQGGEVDITLPAGLAYQGTLDNAGSAFNPTTTVTGTGAQRVNLVFVTQSTSLINEQLVTTIPVVATTTGAKNITMSSPRVADLDEQDITPVTSPALSVNVNAASLPAPTVSRSGGAQLSASNDITGLKQAFTITNFDSGATYTVKFERSGVSQNVTVSGNGFSIPATLGNNDYTLVISSSKSGASGNASFTIRLRSPNVNRQGCVELLDLLAVNGAYGAASTEFDLNFDGSVGLADLLTVTQSWDGACV